MLLILIYLFQETKTDIYTLFTDGASKNNPGPAGAGGVLYSPSGDVVFTFYKYMGTATNNGMFVEMVYNPHKCLLTCLYVCIYVCNIEAEYCAVQEGLRLCHERKIRRLKLQLDSKLIKCKLYINIYTYNIYIYILPYFPRISFRSFNTRVENESGKPSSPL